MTAYLKAHYPVEFMAALLSSDIPGRNFKKKDSLVEHLEDCQRMDIEVLPPDVNRSDVEFAVAEGKICFALSAIKGCGGGGGGGHRQGAARPAAPTAASSTSASGSIRARSTARPSNRWSRRGPSTRSAAGGRSGSPPSTAPCRPAPSAAADRRSGQMGLFGDDEDEPAETVAKDLPDLPEWEQKRPPGQGKGSARLLPVEPSAGRARRRRCRPTARTPRSRRPRLKHRSEVMLGGMISADQASHTKNPKPGSPSRYAMFDLEDTEGIMRCILWPEQFAQYGELVQPDAICVAPRRDRQAARQRRGQPDRQRGHPLEDLEARYTRGIRVRVIEETHGLKKLEMLHEILRGYPGECPLELSLCLADGRKVACRCDNFRVANNPEMRSRVEELLGAENFRLVTGRAGGGNGRGRG